MAAQARGANCEASNSVCHGMFVRRRVQVDWSVGDMPRRVQTSLVMVSACSFVKALGILVFELEAATRDRGGRLAS
jgi:hypothetical protein